MTIKLGLILSHKEQEYIKDEMLYSNSKKFHWLSLANEKKYESYVVSVGKKKAIPSDVAVGLYIESHFKNVEIDYITPEEISLKRFKQNDIVFVLIYDLLESFHVSDPSLFKKYKNTLKKSKNVYPPYEYQTFINNKCDYYKYLEKKSIPIAPTFCITKDKWDKGSDYIAFLLKKIKKRGWESIITKPVYGQESKGFKKFINVQNKPKQLENYLQKNVPKYKSIVFQKYIPDFDVEKPEIRTFFINGKYRYSIITRKGMYPAIPKQEGGTFEFPDDQWKYIKQFAKRVMKELPTFVINDHKQFTILTRIDIGSGMDGVPYGHFVNEVEFVPSILIEVTNYPIIEDISKSLVRVAKDYKESGEINVEF